MGQPAPGNNRCMRGRRGRDESWSPTLESGTLLLPAAHVAQCPGRRCPTDSTNDRRGAGCWHAGRCCRPGAKAWEYPATGSTARWEGLPATGSSHPVPSRRGRFEWPRWNSDRPPIGGKSSVTNALPKKSGSGWSRHSCWEEVCAACWGFASCRIRRRIPASIRFPPGRFSRGRSRHRTVWNRSRRRNFLRLPPVPDRNATRHGACRRLPDTGPTRSGSRTAPIGSFGKQPSTQNCDECASAQTVQPFETGAVPRLRADSAATARPTSVAERSGNTEPSRDRRRFR